MTDLKLPALSPSMEKATLIKWLVRPGDLVKLGDRLVEVETDKTTMELEAEVEGRIHELVIPEGSEGVMVGTVIATFAAADENLSALADRTDRNDGPGRRQDAATIDSDPVCAQSDYAPAAAEFEAADEASPLAHRVANARGLSLSAIRGSGPNGKIVVADLLSRTGAQSQTPRSVIPAEPIASSYPTQPEGVPLETVKLSSMRKAIARRLTASKQEAPHFYLTARCNLDALLAFRGELNCSLGADAVKISVNDLLLKALACALIRVPEANVQFGGDMLHLFKRADIGMAVAIDGGLVTPVLRDVGSLSLAEIAAASGQLAAKAREGTITPHEYEGGTVTFSNLGMFGIDEIVPVLNPPQAVILGTGAGVRQPWEVGGQMKLATIMAATGSFDHRAIDGADAARFMAAFKDAVQSPMSLCV